MKPREVRGFIGGIDMDPLRRMTCVYTYKHRFKFIDDGALIHQKRFLFCLAIVLQLYSIMTPMRQQTRRTSRAKP